jgi:hypothetical protein
MICVVTAECYDALSGLHFFLVDVVTFEGNIFMNFSGNFNLSAKSRSNEKSEAALSRNAV